MLITTAELKDLQEILDLQYLAYQSEAKLHNNFTIQPLTKHQGNGIGSQLLLAIEQCYPECRYELFTSEKSTQNLKFYESKGYHRFMEKLVTPELKLIYLSKNN